MDYKDIIKKTKPEMEKVIGFLEKELAQIRTSRVSPALIEDILVDFSGTKSSLKQLGTISCSGPREILIHPWDRSYVEPIVSALRKNKVGVSPVVDKDVVRLTFPPLSQEYRQELLRGLANKSEETRKTIRHWRDTAWREAQDKFREGEIREDDKFRVKDELQDLIDENNKRIDKIGERKKKEIET